MAQTFNVVFFGPPEQRVVVKATPVTKLEVVLVGACQRCKPPLDPAAHTLHFQKKHLDLQGTVRLSNLPNHSRLDLVKADTPPAPQGGAQQQPPAAAPRQQLDPMGTGALAGQSVAPSTTALPTAAPAADEAPAAMSASAASSSSLGPSVLLFTHEALEKAAAATQPPQAQAGVELSDEFYELTPEDYFSMTAAQERRKKQNNHFKTQALREEEERKRAASYGPVLLRLHLPEGVIIQASFAATDPLRKVQDLLLHAVRPELAKSVYLYTTPPRLVLKDMDATLHHSQLVPAAHIHVGVSDAGVVGATLLRPEFTAQVQQELAAECLHSPPAAPSADNAPSTAGPPAASSSGAHSGAASARGSRAGTTGKAPKWLKLGPR